MTLSKANPQAGLKTITGMQLKYLLRWRFDYTDSKVSKFGGWSRSGETKELQAWCTSKTNLLRACIEGKNIATREIKTFAECDGQNFVNFSWFAGAVGSPFMKGNTTLKSQILGLTLTTRNHSATVQVDGGVRVKPLNEEEKKVNLAGF